MEGSGKGRTVLWCDYSFLLGLHCASALCHGTVGLCSSPKQSHTSFSPAGGMRTWR